MLSCTSLSVFILTRKLFKLKLYFVSILYKIGLIEQSSSESFGYKSGFKIYLVIIKICFWQLQSASDIMLLLLWSTPRAFHSQWTNRNITVEVILLEEETKNGNWGCSKIKFTNLIGLIASIISAILNIFVSQKLPVFSTF